MKPFRYVVLLLLLGSACSSAEIYQWRDAEGKLHFSDSPPEQEGIAVETTQLKPASSYSPPASHRHYSGPASTSSSSQSAAQRHRAVEAERRSKELRQQRCDAARAAYRRKSSSLSGNIASAVKQRDRKAALRDRISRYCH